MDLASRPSACIRGLFRTSQNISDFVSVQKRPYWVQITSLVESICTWMAGYNGICMPIITRAYHPWPFSLLRTKIISASASITKFVVLARLVFFLLAVVKNIQADALMRSTARRSNQINTHTLNITHGKSPFNNNNHHLPIILQRYVHRCHSHIDPG